MPKAAVAIVESVFDPAIRQINALEQRIIRSEDEADGLLWEQAGTVVAQLEAGLSQRDLAQQWLNPRTDEPYSQMHVSFVARLYREKFTFQPRPRFRDAYNALANTSSGGHRLTVQTGEVKWFSPAEIVDAAREVLGEFDLDPASCEEANTKVVHAARFFTEADDGLVQMWAGRVWMNPPYCQPDIEQFCTKFAQHAAARDITGIVLVNNATDTAWFQRLFVAGDAFCFLSGRYPHWQPDSSPDRERSTPLQGQVVVYAGADRDAFYRRFAALGRVLVKPDGNAV